MTRIFIELIKYLTIIIMLLYTFTACRVSIMKPGKPRERRTSFMFALMYMVHAMNFFAIYISCQDERVLILYAAELVVLIGLSALYRVSYKKMSMPVFCNMLMLVILGFIMITRLSFEKGIRQFAIASIALALCLIVPAFIDRFRTLRNYSLFYGIGGLLVLIYVLGFGQVQYGARNWVSIAGILIQPSEFVKLLFIFFVASALSKKHDFKRVILVTILAGAHVIVLVLEKDLGGALLFFFTYIIMLYSATGRIIYLLSGIASGAVASVIAYQLFDHVKVRVAAFLDPFSTIADQGYQIAQSLFAIGTGGFDGMGIMQGLPSSIPVADSDFIFPAISEEMGAVVGICICLICLVSFIMFINISIKFRQPFYKIMALGLSTMYITQVFLNVGGAIKCIPSTGVTLPLISYGGSSLLSSIVMFSIIQGMYVLHMRNEGEEVEVNELEQENRELKRKFYNHSIFKLSYLFSTVMFIVIGYYSYFVVFQGKTFINNSYNKRQDLLAEYIIRGKIYSADGKILAQTVNDANDVETRVYPYGGVFSHVVGRVLHGKTGIEQSESFTMLTSNENQVNQILNTMSGKKNVGDNVITTLDARLQQAAYDALGNNRGSVVVIEPSTGKILAMVSKPDYNPNTILDEWDDLTADTTSPLLNRATQGLYPPGSTFKILTALEYIRENPDYESYEYKCTGEGKFNQVSIHCSGGAHGTQNLQESFANSCNTSFANLGLTLDMDRFHQLCDSFYFNITLPASLLTSKSSFVLDGKSNLIDYAQTVIGLGRTQITPLHNAMITASVANGGVLMKPYLIDRIESASGVVVKQTQPEAVATVMTETESALLKEFMTEVVESGTGTKLSGMKVSVAGKTGTAQYEIGKKAHAWFVGFAPTDEPKLVISVVVESVGSGSKYAVPIAKKIIQNYYSN